MDKRKQISYLSIIVLLISVICQLGCRGITEEQNTEINEDIIFNISTNAGTTRTEYTGLDEDGQAMSSSSQLEKINWLESDHIRIFSNQAYCPGTNQYVDFSVSPSSSNASKANITPLSTEIMQWGETFPHVFIASYPLVPIESDNPEREAVLSISIPSTQTTEQNGYELKPNMEYAYMYAYSKVESKNDVNLVFKPLVTALEFSLLSLADEYSTALTTIKLSSAQTGSYLAGTVSIGVDSEGLVSVDSMEGSNDIDIELPDGGVQLNSEHPYTFTFLCLPLDQTELTLELGFADGSRKRLPLKSNGSWINVGACKKAYFHNIGVPSEVWTYYIATTDPSPLSPLGGTSDNGTVISYKKKGNLIEPVEWEVKGYYSDFECLNQVDRPEWIESITLSGFGSIEVSESFVVTSSASSGQEETITDYSQEVDSEIASNTFGSGSSSSCYYNLSYPRDMLSNEIMESANSYIVNGPGYYRIPLIMGNGIINSNVNSNEYSFLGRGTDHGQLFQDYKEQAVQSPYLHKSNSIEGYKPGTPTSAYVVWEDQGGLIDVIDSNDYELSGQSIYYDSARDVYWLQFHVALAKQGNAVIEVLDENSDVMWSYHIWVTNYRPANYNNSSGISGQDISIVPFDESHSYQIMPINLGWIHSGTAKRITYPERQVYALIAQKEGNSRAVICIMQRGMTLFESEGYSPFYQWGRKDAFWPSDGTSSNVHVLCYGRSPNQVNSPQRVSLGTAIRTPGVFYDYSGSWFKQYGYNLWSAENTETTINYNDVVKTIYDPCPAGYSMPPSGIFTGATVSGSGVIGGVSSQRVNILGSFSKGWYFWSDNTKSEALYYPACGRLKYYPGTLEYVQKRGHYWTACPSNNDGKSYYFFFSTDQVLPSSPDGNHSSGFVVRPIRQNN